ncbi:MAG TPA: hypothetical protein VIJ79_03875 [Acidobacteriaceae bacterium]
MRVMNHFALVAAVAGCLLCRSLGLAQTVVFQQSGFPTIDSEPLSPSMLAAALGGAPVFANVDQLRSGEVLKNATLLVFR